jgi:PAS domain S-box-containing protein
MNIKNCSSNTQPCFEFAADNTSDLIIIIADDFSILFFNQAAAKKFNVKTPDALGTNFFEVFAVAGFKSPIKADYFNQAQKVTIEINDLLWQIAIVPHNNVLTKRAVLIGGKLQNSRQQSIAQNLAQVMDATPGSLYWKDKEGRYLGCNSFMVKTAGLESTNDIIGKTDFDLWPENAKNIRENDAYVMKSKKMVSLEEKVEIQMGKVMYFASVKVPLKDENGNVVGIICNSLDITKLKEAEVELKEAKEKAELSNKAKSDFIHNMEHDIRTPFNGVWGFASVLAEEETDVLKKELLSSIAASAKELLDFCDSILDFSKIEHSINPVLEKSFLIKELVDSVMKIENIAAKNKKLNFSICYSNALPKVIIGDAYRLKRILLNLVGNAIKFTKEGEVKVTVFLEKSNIQNKSYILKFIIEDTGIGIPEDKIDIIYEKFTRCTPSNQGIYKGQGLGLRIVKQFVTELDGEIHLKSELNQGTCFTLLIPFRIPLTDEIIDQT